MEKYIAPTSGYYEVCAKIVIYKPTGKFETVKNPNRRWYEFWKPKFIQREIYEMTEEFKGRDVIYLKQGQHYMGPTIPIRRLIKLNP